MLNDHSPHFLSHQRSTKFSFHTLTSGAHSKDFAEQGSMNDILLSKIVKFMLLLTETCDSLSSQRPTV